MEVCDQVEALLKTFQETLTSGKPIPSSAKSSLSKLKILMTKFQLDPSTFGSQDPLSLKRQLTLARETLELACIYSIKVGDTRGFERHVSQVTPYYRDFAALLPVSERRLIITGLSLLGLLASDRLPDFHTELELISVADQENFLIKFPVELEQRLMEGSYQRILDARERIPDENYSYFMNILIETVREKIEECSESAYESYPVAGAPSLFMTDANKVQGIADTRGWQISGDTITFQKRSGPSLDIPSHTLILNNLQYATELERIV